MTAWQCVGLIAAVVALAAAAASLLLVGRSRAARPA
jgi:hypothetical protein